MKVMDYVKVSSNSKIYQYPLIRLQANPFIQYGNVTSIICDSYMYQNLSEHLLSLDKFDVLLLKLHDKEKEPRLLLGSFIESHCNPDLDLFKYTIDIIFLEELKNNTELVVDLDMEKITSVLNNAWTELNFTEASFYQKLITEKIPMIFEQEALFKVTEDKMSAKEPPDLVEALGTPLRTIYDGVFPSDNFVE
ncbi:MAG: hypothetical protein O4808_07220 [Trichodesmium sp. St17_bin3_1_1]|nr:hypothetical protein [Trichodesmium sp. St17_bin3_1_1]